MTLPRKRGHDPKLKRSGRHADHMGGFGLLPDDNQSVGILAFARSAELFDRVDAGIGQAHVFAQGRRVARLPSDDLDAGVFDNSRSVQPWLVLRAYVILNRLGDAANDDAALAGRAE